MKSKLKRITLVLSAFFMLIGSLVNPISVKAEGINVTKSGTLENFIDNVPVEELTTFIDVDKMTNDNFTWKSTIENVEMITFDGTQILAIKHQLGNGEEYASSGSLFLTFEDAFINSDGSRSDLVLEISDIYIKQLVDNPDAYYYGIISNGKILTTEAFSQDCKGFIWNAQEGDPLYIKANQRTNRSTNFKVYKKDGSNDKFVFGIKDLDVGDYTSSGSTGDYNGEYIESIEAISGYGNVYMPESNILKIEHGKMSATAIDDNTWNTGYISILSSNNQSEWRASGRNTVTKLFETLPFHKVEDSVIGGGEIKYVKSDNEIDQGLIITGGGDNVSIVTRPLEGHKIKKITVDGEDVTPEDKLSEYTYSFNNIQEDHEIIAEYEPFTYKINYDANGGEGDMPSQTFTFEDAEFMSSENIFTREGFTFTGFKLEGREGLITSPEDFKAVLVEMGDGAEITLVAQWEYEQITSFIDIETEETIIPDESGQVQPKDIDGYVYIETEADSDGNWVHKYKAVKTNYVDEDGKELLEPKPGKHDPEEIPGYMLVRTEDDPKGDTTHIYHKVITSWVDESGKALHPSEDGTLDPKVFPNYKLVKTEVKENGDTVHTYHHIQTSWLDEKDEKIVQSKPGEFPKETFPNYEFVKSETYPNGDVVHHYHKLVNLKFVVDGKTVKEDKIKRGADGVAPEVSPKNGYKFVGWDKEFKNIQADTVVTAKLEPIKYPITYVLDGGKNDDANPSSYTVEDAVTLKNPIKFGAKFLGWKEGNAIAKGSTGAKTFTAQWEIVTAPVNTGYNPALIEFATIMAGSLGGLYLALKKKKKN